MCSFFWGVLNSAVSCSTYNGHVTLQTRISQNRWRCDFSDPKNTVFFVRTVTNVYDNFHYTRAHQRRTMMIHRRSLAPIGCRRPLTAMSRGLKSHVQPVDHIILSDVVSCTCISFGAHKRSYRYAYIMLQADFRLLRHGYTYVQCRVPARPNGTRRFYYSNYSRNSAHPEITKTKKQRSSVLRENPHNIVYTLLFCNFSFLAVVHKHHRYETVQQT